MDASAHMRLMTPAMKAHESRFGGRSLREVIVAEFAECSTEELAAEFQVSAMTMRRWLDRLGIERRGVLVTVHAPDASAPAKSAKQPAGAA